MVGGSKAQVESPTQASSVTAKRLPIPIVCHCMTPIIGNEMLTCQELRILPIPESRASNASLS